jgi:hypothetical protein
MKNFYKLITTAILWFAVMGAIHAQPTDNVIAYYPFNGNANDVTGNGKNATNSGAALTSDRLGKANDAYSFNGANNLIYLPINLLPNNTDFSISCWIKINGDRSVIDGYYGQQIVDLRGQYNTNLNYCQAGNPTYHNTIVFNVSNSSSNTNCVAPDNSISFGTWFHVVATYGNNTMQLYLNGVLRDTKSQTPPAVVSGYNNTIGKDYNSRDRLWFNGIIDEVIIYKRSLTSTEVQALYNRGLSSSEIPELYAPIKYTYNTSGDRTGRNLITLKSTPVIAQKDSAGLYPPFGSIPGEVFEENLGEQKIVIYPNPTQGQLLVKIQGYEKESNTALYLYDLSGKLLISKKPANSSMPLDLSEYSVGTYILRITLGDKTSEWKIVKE